MKTINEIARTAGVSRQTLYRILAREGVTLDNVTTETRGTTRYFDEKAEKELVTLIQRASCNNKAVTRDNATTKARQREQMDKLQREAEELRKQLDALTQEREKQDQEIERLKKLTEVQAGTIAQNSITMQQQTETIQRYQERETEKLTNGAEEQRTTSAGWIRRTWARITGKGKEEA